MLIKGLLIGFLILLMLIPAQLIIGLVQERKQRQEQVVEEVSSKWASAQVVTGPVLVVPYTSAFKGSDGKTQTARRNLYILPEHLRITGNVMPELRRRSLYEVMLYRSSLQLDGNFAPAQLAALNIDSQTVSWSEAKLLLYHLDIIIRH